MPFSTTQEIAANTSLKLLSLPEGLRNYMVEKYALQEYTIAGGTYDFEDQDINTLQMALALAVMRSWMTTRFIASLRSLKRTWMSLSPSARASPTLTSLPHGRTPVLFLCIPARSASIASTATCLIPPKNGLLAA